MTTINYNNKKMKLPFEIKISFNSYGKKNKPIQWSINQNFLASRPLFMITQFTLNHKAEERQRQVKQRLASVTTRMNGKGEYVME